MFSVINQEEKPALARFFIQQSDVVSFCFKLKAKWVGKIVSMVSFKDRSKRPYEMVSVGKIAESSKKGIGGMRVWLVKKYLSQKYMIICKTLFEPFLFMLICENLFFY